MDKSLVLAEARGAEERYRLLETLRQYAEERLLQAGEAGAVRDRHAAWCLALGRAIAAGRRPATHPRRNPARRRLLDERESVRAALGWWAADPAAAPPAWSCSPPSARWAWARRTASSRRWLETFLGLAPAPTAARARCLLALDHFLRWEHAFPRALAAAREARELYEALGDDDGAALAAGHEGLVAASLGDYDRGAALLGACLARARARGDWARVEQHARDLGVVALARRDFAEARARIEESRTLAERHGSARSARSSPRASCAWLSSTASRATCPAPARGWRSSASTSSGSARRRDAGRPGGRTCWRWSGAAWPGPRGATPRRGPRSTARSGASTGAARGACCAPPCAWPAWRRSPAAPQRGG